jgi:hypothetical protein
MVDEEEYINRYFLKQYPQKILATFGSLRYYSQIAKYYAVDLTSVSSKREIYNEIITTKWKEQWTDDIRYMQDMGRMRNTYIQMPFYDIKLARFAASIPFDYATTFIKGKSGFGNKTMSINKIILREAYKDKLNDDVFFRNKAVSNTSYLLINGAMRKQIEIVFREDMQKNKNSFIKNYGYENLYAIFLNKTEFTRSDNSVILKIHYLACLCVYNENILS